MIITGMEFKDRLKAARKHAKLTQADLAGIVNLDQASVSHMESGRTLSTTQTATIAKACGVSAYWLETGRGGMLHDSPSSAPKYEMIPLLRASGECGNGHMNEHEEVEGELAFRRDWLRKMGVKAASLRVIYAIGSSMYPSILDGDVLLVNIADQEPVSGKIYALRRPDGSISIKRLNEKFTGGWVISSDNPDKRSYPDEECDESTLHALPIVGRVVWRGGSGF